MERGVKVLVNILLGASLLGLLVIALHPAYRAAARALLRGELSASPIVESNRYYYPDVRVAPEDAR
jgi:hypothetical protein